VAAKRAGSKGAAAGSGRPPTRCSASIRAVAGAASTPTGPCPAATHRPDQRLAVRGHRAHARPGGDHRDAGQAGDEAQRTPGQPARRLGVLGVLAQRRGHAPAHHGVPAGPLLQRERAPRRRAARDPGQLLDGGGIAGEDRVAGHGPAGVHQGVADRPRQRGGLEQPAAGAADRQVDPVPGGQRPGPGPGGQHHRARRERAAVDHHAGDAVALHQQPVGLLVGAEDHAGAPRRRRERQRRRGRVQLPALVLAEASGQVRGQARLQLGQHRRVEWLDGVPEPRQRRGQPLGLGQPGAVGGHHQQRGRVQVEGDPALLGEPPVPGHAVAVQHVGAGLGVGEQQAAVAAGGPRRQPGPLQHDHPETAAGQRQRARAADHPAADNDHVARHAGFLHAGRFPPPPAGAQR
jgi:hypothetical protein